MSFLVDRQDILDWSGEVRAGYDLPRLLRSLISNDNGSISRLDMPASEGARLPGFDGEVEASEPSTLVPAGHSVWELGVEARPASKATRDYKKRTKDPGSVVPAETTFIVVTSRSWPRRARWAAEKRAEGVWQDVRAYDVEDLSAALDRDTPSAILFRDLANRRGSGATTLGHWWGSYRNMFTVPLAPELVLVGRTSQKSQLEGWLAGDDRTIDVRAQSFEDGQAFIASVLDDATDPTPNMVVCDEVGTARDLLARSRQPLVLVTTIDLAELPPLGVHRAIKINASGRSAVELPRQSTRELTELLRAGGVEHHDADRYGAAARRSLYRYRLVCNRATHPLWGEEFRDRRFRQLWLLGGWKRGDTELEALLHSAFGMSVDDAVERVSRDVNSADPIFSHVGDVWRATAPLDSARYFVERSDLVPGDLDAFRPLALSVLGELDPALELPAGERWLAQIKRKTRRYGGRIRRSVATTLTVLASECGAAPLRDGLTIQTWTDQLVRELLEGWDDVPSRWASLHDVLTLLVEAAPGIVLDRIRRDLLGSRENLQSLSTPEQSPFNFGGSSHLTAILWSLQSLMWSPEHCERALDTARDLARGSDEGRNSPTAIGIFRDALLPAIPQCVLGTSGRVAVIERCVRDAPDVAERIIAKTITETHTFATIHQTHFRPWTEDKQRVTWADIFEVYTAMISGAITLADQYPDLWVTLVDAADNVGARGFDQIIAALAALPVGHAKGTPVWQAVQNQLRRHRKFRDADWALPDAYLERLEAAVEHLRPALAREREEWLFGDNRFDLGLASDDIRGEDSLLVRMQSSAVHEIHAEEGFEGLFELARAHPHGAWGIGAALARGDQVLDPAMIAELLKSEEPGFGNLARGYLVNSALEGKTDVLELAESSSDDPRVQARLLLTHPDPAQAWDCAERLGKPVAEAFWAEYGVFGHGADSPHAATAIRKLLDHGRVATALDAITLYREAIPADRRTAFILEGLLQLVRQPPSERAGLPSMHETREFIAIVRRDPSVDRAIVCQLEWAFFPLLEFDGNEPLAIEVAASTSAEDFVHLVNLAYRPKSVAKEDHVFDKEQADVAFRILHRMRYAPGLDGEAVDTAALATWIADVGSLATASDRFETAMHAVGAVLGRYRTGEGEPYPHPAIATALEESVGEEMLIGFSTSVFNGRGVTWRGHGGQQEYDLAEKYEAISRELRDVAPRTSETFGQLARGYRRDGAREDERERRIEDGVDPW
ncbi:hypothetical protein ACFQBY_02515 [Promicromonospora citrea]|uniref:Uncharacterized protein n=1 Tax=Promicromonospora citrea TaxID=43677 RepID=A0A8H9GG16_9MICO|nr:hypothetical protein [Promicromonospora citrea]NNH52425.1 hypothetical protein [Promicromonospora citrea]GGM22141.1 hypothetical protein GCM10010102_17280 [Promicromonospora citrea]